MLKEVRFRFQHDGCWLQETTERFPDLTLVVSSVYMIDEDIHIDLMVHASDAASLATAVDAWKRDARIQKVSKIYEGSRGTRFHVAYSSRGSVYPEIIHHTPISIGTIRMARGTEHYGIVGEAEDVTQLLQGLKKEGRLEVESIRNLEQMPDEWGSEAPSTWASILTGKQGEALVFAHTHGYYQWPRVASASELAARAGLSSSAFLEHLRHAEARVLDTVVEQLRQADPAFYETLMARSRKQRSRASASDGP